MVKTILIGCANMQVQHMGILLDLAYYVEDFTGNGLKVSAENQHINHPAQLES